MHIEYILFPLSLLYVNSTCLCEFAFPLQQLTIFIFNFIFHFVWQNFQWVSFAWLPPCMKQSNWTLKSDIEPWTQISFSPMLTSQSGISNKAGKKWKNQTKWFGPINRSLFEIFYGNAIRWLILPTHISNTAEKPIWFMSKRINVVFLFPTRTNEILDCWHWVSNHFACDIDLKHLASIYIVFILISFLLSFGLF